MRVSVILAAHNAADSLGRALDSALGQTEPDLQVIVVDDASTDRTADIAAAYAARDPRLQLVRARRNLGPGGARNLGLEAARGDWIAVLDADDRFSGRRLARLQAIGEEIRADMVADNLLLCPEGHPGHLPMFPPGSLPAHGTIDAVAFVDSNTARRRSGRRAYGYLKPLIRRSFLTASGLRYDPARFAEDYIFYLRCQLHGARWTVTPETMYEYTVVKCHPIGPRPNRAQDVDSVEEMRRVLGSRSAPIWTLPRTSFFSIYQGVVVTPGWGPTLAPIYTAGCHADQNLALNELHVLYQCRAVVLCGVPVGCRFSASFHLSL